jgi:hypothetical protein
MSTRYQKPVKGGRKSLPSCVNNEIFREVDRMARHEGVSRSFVIAVALANQFGITEQELFGEANPHKTVWRRTVRPRMRLVKKIAS